MTRKAIKSNKPRMNKKTAKARGSRTQKRTMTGGISLRFGKKLNLNIAGTMTGLKSKQQHQSTSAIKQLGLMSRTKKFFGGLKQKLSNKMSGVSKFESLFNSPKQIKLKEVSYTIYYFKADKDKLINCKGYEEMQEKINPTTTTTLAGIDTLNQFYTLLNDKENQIITKLQENKKLGLIYMHNNKSYLGTQEINDSTPTYPKRIFMYATYSSSQQQNAKNQTGQYEEPHKFQAGDAGYFEPRGLPTDAGYEALKHTGNSYGGYMAVENAGFRPRAPTIPESAELPESKPKHRESSSKPGGLQMTNASTKKPLLPGPNSNV